MQRYFLILSWWSQYTTTKTLSFDLGIAEVLVDVARHQMDMPQSSASPPHVTWTYIWHRPQVALDLRGSQALGEGGSGQALHVFHASPHLNMDILI